MQFDIIEYFTKTKQHLWSARIHYVVKSSGLNSARAHLESVLSLHDSVYENALRKITKFKI